MSDGFLFDVDPGLVCGSDEAGRGPLAGPVYAASVVLPSDFPVEILGDSKALSLKRRLYAEAIIKEKAVWAVSFCTAEEIDRINILQASLLAMAKSAQKVHEKAAFDCLLVDGNKKPLVPWPCNAIVKGDATIPQIMAASILAKCARDRFMESAALKWPHYGFEVNKGYPTKAHRQACLEWGLCPIHRRTFTLRP
ncbi:MAG: ribonuclease HII [Sphaerochaetaceae bacterium]|jgi:ribonuclease HII|nr:ribonuclease HII [Sphaerochaetaceae bacterium]